MANVHLARRLRRQPRRRLLGRDVRVARDLGSRLLGLALLDLERAGSGLLIPHCRSVHTFGMRFALDVHFLNARGEPISVRRGVGPNRIVCDRRAVAVLELPTTEGGRH